MVVQTKAPEEKDLVKAEKERLLILLMSNSARMAAEYKQLVKPTGGLLTNSMVYAYSKGLNDALKLLTKDENEKPV